MFKVLSFLKPYKLQAIFAPLFKMTEALLELFIPIIISRIIDVGISGADRRYVVFEALMLLLLAVLGLLFSVTAQYFSAKAAVGMSEALKSALFSHIGSLCYSDLDRVGTSTLIARMTSDVNQVQSGVNLTLRLFLRSPFIVIGAIVMAFSLDRKSALIFVITIAALSAVVFAVIGVTIPKYKTVQSRLDALILSVRENLSGVRVLRAFCKENEETDTFDSKNNLLNRTQRAAGRISALMNPVTLVIINLAVIAVLWSGAVKVNSGELSKGTVVALYNYMAQILIELIKLANLIVSITKAAASSGRIGAVFNLKPSVDESRTGETFDFNSDYAVEFNNASFKYPGASEDALSDISFKLKKGETLGIIGGTGSGKSTLVNLIPGFFEATGGSVSVFGVDIKNSSIASLRAIIGIVPQKAVLFKGTLSYNMRISKPDATDEEIIEALKISQSYDFVKEKPGGIEFEIEQGGKNLSGGQRQRLTVARALVRKPKLLILDDSASALDLATDYKLRKSIFSLSYHPTTVIVSQRSAAVMNCDKILVLDDGRLVAAGTHSELLESSDIYSEIYYSQFRKDGE